MIPYQSLSIIRQSVSFEDPDFPLEFFITEMQQLSLSPKVTKFLADLLLRIPNVANKNNLRETTADPTSDRKARVTISVSLLQYDGSKGHAAKFVVKFTHLVTTQKLPESEWDSLLMDSLKKEALKHFESSRRKFTSHNSYFKDFIEFFDHRSVLDERKWYKDTFQQQHKKPVRTFYLQFLQTVEHLQTLNLFPADSSQLFHSTFMDDFFCKLNDECYSIVDNKLRDSGKRPEDVTHTSIFAWVDTAQKYNNSIHTLTSATDKDNEKKSDKKKRHAKRSASKKYQNQNTAEVQTQSKPDQVCFWCEKKGHTHKSPDKQNGPVRTIYQDGKDPSASWEAHRIKKGYPPWLTK